MGGLHPSPWCRSARPPRGSSRTGRLRLGQSSAGHKRPRSITRVLCSTDWRNAAPHRNRRHCRIRCQQSVKLYCPSSQLWPRLHLPLVLERGLSRPQHLPDRVPRHLQVTGDLLDRVALDEVLAPDPGNRLHDKHPHHRFRSKPPRAQTNDRVGDDARSTLSACGIHKFLVFCGTFDTVPAQLDVTAGPYLAVSGRRFKLSSLRQSHRPQVGLQRGGVSRPPVGLAAARRMIERLALLLPQSDTFAALALERSLLRASGLFMAVADRLSDCRSRKRLPFM